MNPTTIKQLAKYLTDPAHKYLNVTHHATDKDTPYGRMEVKSITLQKLYLLAYADDTTSASLEFIEFTENGFKVFSHAEKTRNFEFEYLPLDTTIEPIKRTTVSEIIYRHAQARIKHIDNFQATFKIDLRRFWLGNELGFNIVAFDEWLKVPDDVSMKDHITALYGEDAMNMVNELL